MKKLQHAQGFTLIGLLIVVAIIGIIAAIAVPGLLRARMSGNEASAIGSLRAITSGEAAFSSSCGRDPTRYPGAPRARANRRHGFISPDLNVDGRAEERLQHHAGSCQHGSRQHGDAVQRHVHDEERVLREGRTGDAQRDGHPRVRDRHAGNDLQKQNSATANTDPIASTATPLQ